MCERLKSNECCLTLESTSQTRWSADANAIQALRLGYNEVLVALEDNISQDLNQNPTTQNESILSKLKKKINWCFHHSMELNFTKN